MYLYAKKRKKEEKEEIANARRDREREKTIKYLRELFAPIRAYSSY